MPPAAPPPAHDVLSAVAMWRLFVRMLDIAVLNNNSSAHVILFEFACTVPSYFDYWAYLCTSWCIACIHFLLSLLIAVTKDVEKTFAAYDGTRSHNIACNSITFSTILDACAKSCALTRASGLLQDMVKACVDPDTTTYSTIIKGYCVEGSVNRAFHILEDMKSNGKYKPDEVMYNSILDGRAKLHRTEDVLKEGTSATPLATTTMAPGTGATPPIDAALAPGTSAMPPAVPTMRSTSARPPAAPPLDPGTGAIPPAAPLPAHDVLSAVVMWRPLVRM